MAEKFKPLAVTWLADQNPLAAKEIAADVANLLRQMDEAHDRSELGRLYDGFKDYAARRRVCGAICEHVTSKFFSGMKAGATQ